MTGDAPRARAPASLMRPVVSPTGVGRMPPSTTTRSILPPSVSLIALINVSTRLCVITGQPGGDHRPASSDNEDSPVWKERHELSA